MTPDQIQKAAAAVFKLHQLRADKTRPRSRVYSGRKRGRPRKIQSQPV